MATQTEPSLQNILDRLKSNGTFDQFRKMCLSAIEEEPSYRAQKEHVEILSRRFLNDNETKGMAKNEVRSKLRLYVLEELKKPGVQASHTIEELVENTLESKSSQLFKDILDVMATLINPPSPSCTENTTQEDIQSSHQSVSGTNKQAPPTNSTTKGSFELPIDLLTLPGLSNSCIISESSGKRLNKVSKKKDDSNCELQKRKVLKSKDLKEKDCEKLKRQKATTTKHEEKLLSTIEEMKTGDEKSIKVEEKDKKEIEEKENKECKDENEVTNIVIKKDEEKEIKDTNDIMLEDAVKFEEEDEELFIDTANATVAPCSPDRKSLRRSARIASYSSNGDKSREGTPADNKRQLSIERDIGEENVSKKRKTSDRRHVIRDSTSSDDNKLDENELQERGHRKRKSVKRVNSSPTSKLAKKSTLPVVTRSNRQVKRSYHYYPGEEQTESEEDEREMEEKEDDRSDQEEEEEEEERKNEKETTSRRRSKRIKK